MNDQAYGNSSPNRSVVIWGSLKKAPGRLSSFSGRDRRHVAQAANAMMLKTVTYLSMNPCRTFFPLL